jgi:hypothetical protein
MTSAPFAYDTRPIPTVAIRQPLPQSLSGRNLLLRVVDAIRDSNRRKAEREIARYIERNGGRLTDTIERGIERSLF